jgi:probable HAF family extracellular repeat protein
MKKSVVLTLSMLLGGISYPSAEAASVSVTALSGAVGRLHGINNLNQAVGNTVGGDEVEAVLYQNGATNAIEIPGSIQSQAFGIENNGRVVGAYTDTNLVTHGYIYFHGTVTNIDYPGSTFTQAWGINDSQRIVGNFRDPETHLQHGFLYNNGKFTQLDVPGAVSTWPRKINNAGAVVGYFTSASGPDFHSHGFLYDKSGKLTKIDAPFAGATDTFLSGINNSGVMVGYYIDAEGTHAFADIAGRFIGLDAPDTPPGIGTVALSINDNGATTAYGSRALLGTVTP